MIYTSLSLLIIMSATATQAEDTWHDNGQVSLRLATAEHLVLAELSVEKDNLRPGISLDAAVEEVRSKTGGRILSAKTEKNNGQITHRIKALISGTYVQVYRIRADKE
ncbi:MAG: hypothetical protein KAJ19_07950 [Gammaproteobacteria bacterium]|nr:hypothetical protein [Gammaproteobacteria bacterium]